MKKLSLGRKLAFAACDVLGGGAFNIINFLYPVFLALTVGLSAYWISVIMLVTRIWDAFIDPLIGQISDSTKSRLGKRRIYMVIAAPIILIAMVFMFYPYSFESMTARALAVLASYVAFCTTQSVIMVPYYSLSSEISDDYQERASANSWRLCFSIFSSIICVSVPGIIVNAYEGSKGYLVMGLIFGSIFCLCVLTTGLFAKETIHTPPMKFEFNFKPFHKLLRLPPFRQYISLLVLLQMTMVVMSGLFFFYVDFYLCRDLTAAGKSNILGLISAALMFSVQIVGLPFYLHLIKKAGKPAAYRFGAVIWIITGILLFFVRPGAPGWQIILLGITMGFGISGPGLVPHTMLGDVSDAAQLVYGNRCDGALGGLVNFISKVSQAIGISVAMAILGYFGFQQAQPGQTVLSQPESAQNAIRALMAFAPLLMLSIGIAISYRYKISAKLQQEIKNAIEKNERPDNLINELMQISK
jgi:Na+/melibiose symporter and related transporters